MVDFVGGVNDDLFDGSETNDTARGGGGNDTLNGNGGSDALLGEAGDDILNGGAEDDTLVGGVGRDSLYGGDGNDVFYIHDLGEYQANEIYDGGADSDTVHFNLSFGAVIDLRTAQITGIESIYFSSGRAILTMAQLSGFTRRIEIPEIQVTTGGSFTANALLRGFFYLSDEATTLDLRLTTNSGARGGAGDDILYASRSSPPVFASLYGGGGNDRLYGGISNEVLDGEAGDDIIEAGEGEHRLYGGSGNDQITSGSGNDIVYVSTGIDTVSSGDGNDLFYINSNGQPQAGSSFNGGIGNDVLIIESGAGAGLDLSSVQLLGFEGLQSSVTVTMSPSQLASFASVRGEFIFSSGGSAILSGTYRSGLYLYLHSAGNVVDMSAATITNIVGGFDDIFIYGGNGNDSITGTSTLDRLIGGAGNDVISGGGGRDTIEGGAGVDTLSGGEGDDIFIVNSPSHIVVGDTFDGGNGYDKITFGGAVDLSFVDLSTIESVEGGTATLTTAQLAALQFFGAAALANGGVVTFNPARTSAVIIAHSSGNSIDLSAYASGHFYLEGAATGTGANHFIGSGGTNQLIGGGGDDMITGGAGADLLDGRAGNDVVEGGLGNDTITGGLGRDTLRGGGGNDTIVIGNFDHFVVGETYDGGDGFDILKVDFVNNGYTLDLTTTDLSSFEAVDGRATAKLTNAQFAALTHIDGRFAFTGGGSISLGGKLGLVTNPWVLFQLGDTATTFDASTWSSGSFNLTGGAGDDTIIGPNMISYLFGGGGNDRFIVKPFFSQIVGDAGIDVVDYSNYTGAVTVSLGNGGSMGSGPNNQTLFAIEDVDGSAFGDTINGSSDANVLKGNGGNDRLNGRDGNDTLHGGTGVDTMDGGTGDDIIVVDADGDIVIGGDGIDTVRFAAAVTHVAAVDVERFENTGIGDVFATLNALANTYVGGVGADLVYGGTGGDTIGGGAGSDGLFGETGNDIIDGGDGQDKLDGGADNDTLNGGAEGDNLRGGEGDDVLDGGAGSDAMNGGAGVDIFTGGEGRDKFRFGNGDTGNSTATADRITDLDQAQGERISLTAMDAIVGGADDAFTFIGTAAFGNVAGQLRYELIGGNTYVMGDTDGDGASDFMIRVDGALVLSGADFSL